MYEIHLVLYQSKGPVQFTSPTLTEPLDSMPLILCALKSCAPFTGITPFMRMRVDRDTILDRGCTYITAGGPTISQHWFKVVITGTTFMRTTQDVLLSVDWMLASAWDGGAALRRHWVSVSSVHGTCIVVTRHIAKHNALPMVE